MISHDIIGLIMVNHREIQKEIVAIAPKFSLYPKREKRKDKNIRMIRIINFLLYLSANSDVKNIMITGNLMIANKTAISDNDKWFASAMIGIKRNHT